jgi:hypothetical protein
MKKILAPLFAVALLNQGYAAVYNSNFSGSFGDPGDGVDGWNQSEADASPLSPKTWIAPVTSNNYVGLAIGGFYDIPTTDPLTSTVSLPAIALVDPNSVEASISLDFALNDSTGSFPDRNTFFFNVLDGNDVSIASVVFIPISQTVPGTLGVDNQWNVYLNGNLALGVFSGGDYSLSVDFLNANQFTATITNTITNVGLTSGAITRGAGSGVVIEGLQLGFEQGPGSDWGDNTFGIANVSVVPEPSSAMLVGLAALGLMRRRRA